MYNAQFFSTAEEIDNYWILELARIYNIFNIYTYRYTE